MTAERTYTTDDRTGWGEGPWSSEPDKIVWVDEDTDLDCMIRRGPLGSLCGYVAVPPSHPWHGKGCSEHLVSCDDADCYGHSPDSNVEVHGGLTYADACFGEEEDGICHVPEPGRTHDVWWFGFDCGHSRDISPGLEARERAMASRLRWADIPNPWPRQYRDVAYVRAEVLHLARQLKAEGRQ